MVTLIEGGRRGGLRLYRERIRYFFGLQAWEQLVQHKFQWTLDPSIKKMILFYKLTPIQLIIAIFDCRVLSALTIIKSKAKRPCLPERDDVSS